MQLPDERDFTVRKWSDFFKLDWILLGPVLILLLFSLVLLKSIEGSNYFSKQLILLTPAIVTGIFMLFIRIKFLESISPILYVFSLLLLLSVLAVGSSSMGAQRWINLGFIKIQPSEISKIAIIISLAAWLSRKPIKNYFDITIAGLIILVPFLLIFKQPDLGTSLTFVAIYLGMTFWAGARITQLLVLLSPALSLIFNSIGQPVYTFGITQVGTKIIEITATGYFILYLSFLIVWLLINYKPWRSPLIVLLISIFSLINFIIGCARPILWNLLEPYQQKRLTIFLNPESDPLGSGYHIIQSILAIGNGGFFGYGWQNGRLTKGGYVPAQHTDFIFSICGEEFGFIGSIIILSLFAIILSRIIYIAINSNNQFASLIAIGIFSYFSFHIFINIGMAIGIMPITGVPLIFLSYGGTVMFASIISVFLLLSISWRTLEKRMF